MRRHLFRFSFLALAALLIFAGTAMGLSDAYKGSIYDPGKRALSGFHSAIHSGQADLSSPV